MITRRPLRSPWLRQRSQSAAALGGGMDELEVLVASCSQPHRADLERCSAEVAVEGHDQAVSLVLVDPEATADDVDRRPDLVAAAGCAELAPLEREPTARHVTGGGDA